MYFTHMFVSSDSRQGIFWVHPVIRFCDLTWTLNLEEVWGFLGGWVFLSFCGLFLFLLLY